MAEKHAIMHIMDKKIRVIVVHGWASSPDDCWFPWLKRELERKRIVVEIPEMPNPKNPNMDEWMKKLGSVIGNPDEKTLLIGHSLGAHLVLKFVESLPSGSKIGGVICVAGRLVRDDGSHVDAERVRKITKNVIGIFSDNDYHVSIEEAKRFRDFFGKNTKILENRGHFSRKEGARELPELLEMFNSIIRQ